eukprot:scaffold303104_cov36-Tisochrysis_lutea.AAC.1
MAQLGARLPVLYCWGPNPNANACAEVGGEGGGGEATVFLGNFSWQQVSPPGGLFGLGSTVKKCSPPPTHVINHCLSALALARHCA